MTHFMAVKGNIQDLPHVDGRDAEGFTPLMCCALRQNLEAVNALLKQPGVQVEAVDSRQGRTALLHAASQGLSTEVMETLVQAGHADITARDAQGRTALMLAALSDPSQKKAGWLIHTLHRLG